MLRRRPPPTPAPAEEDFDEFLGIGTGAAALFGATGGVMEAALRCAPRGGRLGAGLALRCPAVRLPSLRCCSTCSARCQPAASCRPAHPQVPRYRSTVYDVATGEKLDRLEWAPVRGLEGTKEASVVIAVR